MKAWRGEKGDTMMAEESGVDYSKDHAVLLKNHTDQAIRCCINAWNQLCPQHPLTNLTKAVQRKRWWLFGSEVVVLEQSGDCGQISKITLGINKRHTRRTFRKYGDQLLMTVNCWICWNCGAERVRGWPDHIVVDVKGNCVVRFPDVARATPHVHWYPLP